MHVLCLTIHWKGGLRFQIPKPTFLLQSYKFCVCMQIYSTTIYFDLSHGLQCSAGAQMITALFAIVSKLDIDITIIMVIISIIISIVIIVIVDIRRKNSLLKFYITFFLFLSLHRAFCSLFNYTQHYTGCPRRNVRDFGRVFLMLNYTDITQNTYIQSWSVTEIMARQVWNFDSCYSLIDYQIHIETGRNMWFL